MGGLRWKDLGLREFCAAWLYEEQVFHLLFQLVLGGVVSHEPGFFGHIVTDRGLIQFKYSVFCKSVLPEEVEGVDNKRTWYVKVPTEGK